MDELYIKMCKEATEIQEGWDPKPGDKVYNDTFGFSHLPKEFVDEVVKDMDFFLPSQEDLQQIKANQYGHTPYAVQKYFNSWFNELYILDDPLGNHGGFPHSRTPITTLWLVFVMETGYNKKWNGTTWEMIK